MSQNRAVAYQGPGVVEVIDTPFPEFELKDGPGVNPANVGRKVPHGAILRTVTTNICGSDQHIALFALAGLHEVVKASVAGSLLGNILLVMGVSMLARRTAT